MSNSPYDDEVLLPGGKLVTIEEAEDILDSELFNTADEAYEEARLEEGEEDHGED